jgi:Mn-dependent DtxR family transcriptional regulator
LRGTISREDYLEAILFLSEKSKRANGGIRSADVARHMDYSSTATLKGMDRLEKDNLIRRDEKRLIRLTEAGYARAVKIRERHMFFKEILMRLGMSAEAAEEAACEMEHGANDEVFELLKKFYAEALNKPCFKLGFCPRERSFQELSRDII